MKKHKEIFEITDLMVTIFFTIIDCYCNFSENDIAEILMEFRVFEKKCIKGLYDRMYKKYPYDTMAKMELCVDSERTKIKRFVHKK